MIPTRPTGHRRRRSRPVLVVVLGIALAAALVAGTLLVVGGTPGRDDGADGGVGGPPAGPDPVALANAAPQPAGVKAFEVGTVGSEGDQALGQVAALGSHVMRTEFTADTTAEQLAPLVGRLADRGIRLQPLVGWEDGEPAPDLTGVARWAAAFGPGGTFWAGRPGTPPQPVTDIELGNENSYYYKSGEWNKPAYSDLATAYGRRAADAARAIDAANPAVGVLVELDAGDSEQPMWIDRTLAAGGPDLVRLLHAPVIHAYGPDWRRELDQDFRAVARWGVHKPFAMTEWGIASDDGTDLSDNYDFPTDLTYERAGGLLSTALGQMSTLRGELRQVLLYQLADQRDPGEDTEREHYFGLLRRDGSDKGAVTAAARSAYARFP